MSPSIKAMVGTGERTGNLPMVLNSIADHLDSIADKQAKRLSAVFEPAAIIVMGGVIGFIAVSVLFPLFRLTAAVKGAS
jgi:type II secretory pathway component PulF